MKFRGSLMLQQPPLQEEALFDSQAEMFTDKVMF